MRAARKTLHAVSEKFNWIGKTTQTKDLEPRTNRPGELLPGNQKGVIKLTLQVEAHTHLQIGPQQLMIAHIAPHLVVDQP